jgi:hypothetical protein
VRGGRYKKTEWKIDKYRNQSRQPHLLGRSGGSDGGFYSNAHSNNNNYENNNNSNSERNFSKGKSRSSESPRYSRGSSYSNSSSNSNNYNNNNNNNTNNNAYSNKYTNAAASSNRITPPPQQPQQRVPSQQQQSGYYDNSGLFIPHPSPSPSPVHQSPHPKPALVHSSSWKGWSQPEATKSRESQDTYLDTNFPVLQASAFAKSLSATNSDAGSSKYAASSDGALDGESDISFSGDKNDSSDTTSIVDDFNFASELTSPRSHHEAEADEALIHFANIFNLRSHAPDADVGIDDAGAGDTDAHGSGDEGIIPRNATVRSEQESDEIAEKSHDHSSNGHGNGSQKGKGKKSLADADTENGIVVIRQRDENDHNDDNFGSSQVRPLPYHLLFLFNYFQLFY